MIYFVNKLEFNYNKYQSNGTVQEENYKAKFLFTMNEFVSFGTDNELIVFVFNIFYRKILMESVCHNLNLLKFETKRLPHKNNGLRCVLLFAMCGGGTDIWYNKCGDIV